MTKLQLFEQGLKDIMENWHTDEYRMKMIMELMMMYQGNKKDLVDYVVLNSSENAYNRV